MRKKTDLNQRKLVYALKQIPGVSIQDLSAVGQGCPDLLVGYKGKNYLFEIKNPETKGKLNERQEIWFSEWKGHVCVVRDIDDLLDVLWLEYTK